MKFCPTCETRYDEEILRFCTKDGTKLIEEAEPSFTALPSEANDDIGEETIISYRPKNVQIPPPPDIHISDAPRIVISTDEQRDQSVRPRVVAPTAGAVVAAPARSNTAKVVVLTIVGTLAVLGIGVLLFVMLRDDQPASNANVNVNTNPPNINVNLDTNLNSGAFNYNVPTSNFNVNTNFNLNLNMNVNANKTPKPSPSATVNTNVNVNASPANTATPTPRPTASPSASATPSPTTTTTPAAPPRTTPTPSKPTTTPTLPGGRPANN